MDKFIITILFYFIIQSLYAQQEPKNYNFIIEDSAYWTSVSPINFLDTLKKYPNSVFCISITPNNKWFDRSLLSNIKKEKDNQTPAGIVYSRNENNEHDLQMHSTVGIQARFIIEGYKKKKFPPTLCSFHYFKPKK